LQKGEIMEDFYYRNEDFKLYVDKYCKSYGISKEEAFTHKLVQEVKEQYEGMVKK
jgi:hypothetical protein